MVTAIILNNLRNPEYIQFNKDFLKIVELNDPAALQVLPQFNACKTMLGTLEDIYLIEQGSALTQDIGVIDGRRDKAISGITVVISGFIFHYDAVIAKHAELLNRQVQQYGGGVARQNYMAETAIITNLLGDFANKPELAAAVTALNLGDWVKELDTANKIFNDVYLQRTQQIGAVTKDRMFDKRQEANELYYKLRNFIDSYFTIKEGAEPYNKTTNELNALVDQYNVMMAGRGGKDDKGGDNPTPPAE